MYSDERNDESRVDKMHAFEDGQNGNAFSESIENSEPFGKPIAEALKPRLSENDPPLLSQEEIYDGKPLINWTAVICTAIVVAAATVIICVAKPWRAGDSVQTAAVVETGIAEKNDSAEFRTTERTDTKHTVAAEPEEKVADEPTAVVPQKTVAEVAMPVQSTLPVVPVTTTGTDNMYNNVRLIDASSRLLKKDEVAQMTKDELALARNAIYARHGYSFKNPELGAFFSAQTWFNPTGLDINSVPFTETELANIKLIKSVEETKK